MLFYQLLPFLCFSNPKSIVLALERRALSTEGGHGTAMCEHIHFGISPSQIDAQTYARNVPVFSSKRFDNSTFVE